MTTQHLACNSTPPNRSAVVDRSFIIGAMLSTLLPILLTVSGCRSVESFSHQSRGGDEGVIEGPVSQRSLPADAATGDTTQPDPSGDPSGDPYLWLEDVAGEKSLAWVTEQNAKTVGELATGPEFDRLVTKLLSIYDSNEQIPYINKIGGYYYNFWQDATHQSGIWRRTSIEEYRKAAPRWETVLDLDALNAAEGANWVWKGGSSLAPSRDRFLVSLSRGGADATEIREFDLGTKSFVKNGFVLPESKGGLIWIDRDHVYVTTDFGPGSMTASGYPRIAKIWKRGTPLSSAETVYEGKPDDVMAVAFYDNTVGFERHFVYRGIAMHRSEVFLRRNGQLLKIDIPTDADFNVHREWLTVSLRSDWTAGGTTYPAGALLVTKFDPFMNGERRFEILFQPSERKSLAGMDWTRNHLLLNELDNVRNKLYLLTPEKGVWKRKPLEGMPEFGTVSVWAVDVDSSDNFFVYASDFITPASLSIGTVGAAKPQPLKKLPDFFDASGLVVTQHQAVSKDGTRVPYFQVSRRNVSLDGSNPTLLYGYGGFEVPQVPYYAAGNGVAWLEKGGVYVLANIRGGGEFGPQWHQAAIKQNKHRSYEDFIAIAEDLIARKVTSTPHLGVMGGSNGGLLTGNMLTLRPDLFGAVVSQVPLMDMRRYHHLLAGASWMGEYGNPDEPAEWEYIRTFSPYHNLKPATKYPPTLITTSTRDDRVHPGHARKMVALMKSQGHNVRYYENKEGGHAGSANNRQAAFMSALAYTFLWRHLK